MLGIVTPSRWRGCAPGDARAARSKDLSLNLGTRQERGHRHLGPRVDLIPGAPNAEPGRPQRAETAHQPGHPEEI